jgi:hypothetical protein
MGRAQIGDSGNADIPSTNSSDDRAGSPTELSATQRGQKLVTHLAAAMEVVMGGGQQHRFHGYDRDTTRATGISRFRIAASRRPE